MLKALAEQTGTNEADWREIEGIPTGVGVERWFRHKATKQEAYVCDDQGSITISLN